MDEQTHLLILLFLEGLWADETIFYNCQVGFCQQTFLQPSTADVVPLGVEEMTAGGWCIVAPLGTAAAALALKDRFQQASQTFFSLLCCNRHLGQPRSHHISSKCESRPSSLWTPGATSKTLLSDQTRPSSSSSFFVIVLELQRLKKSVFFLLFFASVPDFLLQWWNNVNQNVDMFDFQTINAKILHFCGGVRLLWGFPTSISPQMWRWMLSDTLLCSLGEGALWQLPEWGVFQHQGRATKYRTDLHFHN